jgi:hypothetical protein
VQTESQNSRRPARNVVDTRGRTPDTPSDCKNVLQHAVRFSRSLSGMNSQSFLLYGLMGNGGACIMNDDQFITAAPVPSRGRVFSNGSTGKTERQKIHRTTYLTCDFFTIALAWTIGRLLPRLPATRNATRWLTSQAI